MIRRLSATLAAVLLTSACAAPMASRPGPQAATSEPVTVGIIGINDFHGAIEPPKQSVFVPDGKGGTVGIPAGGAAWLASAIDGIRAHYPNNVVVSAGDMISASQFASSVYLDEPTIGVMNRIGVAFNAVGNHEFDRGRDELLRMQNGGCDKHTARQPCQLERFAGAQFKYLAASTKTEDGSTLFPATGLKSFGEGSRKVTVGFIGLTLKGTPELVSAAGIKGLTFADEADTVNAAVPQLKAQGADAVVVLIHQGGKTPAGSDPSGCTDFIGDIQPIIDRLDPAVDVVVSGHTHWAYVCDYAAINPAKPVLLTSAGVYGELVSDIELKIDPATHRVVSKKARNVVVQSPPYTASRGPVPNSDLVPVMQPRADVRDYVARYVEAAKAFSERTIGKLAGPATRREIGDVDYGGPLAGLIADAQLAATKVNGAQLSFMNAFGVRAPLVPAADGNVSFGMIYATQPFNNQLVTMTMSGADLKAMLEQSFQDSGPEQFLTPSAGFTYTVDRKAVAGSRVSAMKLGGKVIDPKADYRITVSDFLSNGGDGFSVFAQQRDKVRGATDIDALEAWIKAVPVRAVPSERRVLGH
ncbi:bifunctional metallophosphatase/5'-nucleotidase [Novosphingobium sp. JCM 18896]|uniref:bifunctional metallophosphatase/5'-nucleotidase n=1 Tax=Novosphingobium sp. JCM 18896 TaxID=2989731 RepID=UPI002223E77C|nr:bifunctional metallophosphatase/5'-nucleotidase [Novosphingobium sp. JCM 18896]MCW1429025.1 bifunctional metallophosphatase/5'-nucleotidase [Novosphingobium sp. JCM 18896]